MENSLKVVEILPSRRGNLKVVYRRSVVRYGKIDLARVKTRIEMELHRIQESERFLRNQHNDSNPDIAEIVDRFSAVLEWAGDGPELEKFVKNNLKDLLLERANLEEMLQGIDLLRLKYEAGHTAEESADLLKLVDKIIDFKSTIEDPLVPF